MTEEIQKGEETTLKTTPNSEESKKEEDKSKETEEETKKVESEESEEEESGEVEEETTEKPQREARFVPYGKFKDARDEVRTLKAEIEKLSKRPESAGTDDAIKKLSEKYPEVGKEFMEDMISAAREGSKLPSDIAEKLQKIEAHELEITQEKGFEKDFAKLIKDVPEADDPKVKAKLKTLAFTEEFAKAPLKAIFYGNPDEFGGLKPKKSAEPSKGGNANLGEMTFEEIDNLPPEDRAKAIKDMDMPTYEKFRSRMRTNNSFKIGSN